MTLACGAKAFSARSLQSTNLPFDLAARLFRRSRTAVCAPVVAMLVQNLARAICCRNSCCSYLLGVLHRAPAHPHGLVCSFDKFFEFADPNKDNLCLYGLSTGAWEVDLPAEEVPPEMPEPALGINFARDGMTVGRGSADAACPFSLLGP